MNFFSCDFRVSGTDFGDKILIRLKKKQSIEKMIERNLRKDINEVILPFNQRVRNWTD